MQQQSWPKWLTIGGSLVLVAGVAGILKTGTFQKLWPEPKTEKPTAPVTAQIETLDESAYQMVIQGRLKEVQACYNAELKKGLAIKEGKMIVKWMVNPEGKSHDFQEELNELQSSELYRCAIAAIAKWPFPKKQNFLVRYTFKMREMAKPAQRQVSSVQNEKDKAPAPITDDVQSQLGEL